MKNFVRTGIEAPENLTLEQFEYYGSLAAWDFGEAVFLLQGYKIAWHETVLDAARRTHGNLYDRLTRALQIGAIEHVSKTLAGNFQIFASPKAWITWASENTPEGTVHLRWVDWLEVRTSKDSEKPPRETKPRKRISEQHVADIRKAGNRLAAKYKRRGMPIAKITAKRIANDLYSDGHLSNEKRISDYCRSSEGVRVHLKKEHHPKNSDEFKRATPDR